MCSHASFLFLCTQAEGLEEHNGHLAGQVEGLMEDYEALKEFTTVRVAQEIPIIIIIIIPPLRSATLQPWVVCLHHVTRGFGSLPT